MRADRLLAHYEQLGDDPETIQRFRRLILHLAVRGVLVSQDADDEPASELLKCITAEKVQLVRAGKIKKADVQPLDRKDEPFEIPLSWVWTRLGAIGDWGSGSTPPRGNPDFYGGGITWLKSGELNDNRHLEGSEETVTKLALAKGSFRSNRPGDVLIAMYGATIGKVAILAEEAVTNQAVCGCTPFSGVSNQYLFLFLLSQREQFRTASEGGAQPNISKVKIVRTPFPLPPLAEQLRIVAKVDELMTLCDQLEAARAEREAMRDRFNAASLALLNAPDPDTFAEDARFALDNLASLTTRPDQIKEVRQTILNLAVRGKLVQQDPADEPAFELLKRIEDDNGNSAHDAAVFDGQTSTELPDGWSMGPLIALGVWAIGTGFPKSEQGCSDGLFMFLKVSDMNLPGNEKYITVANNFIDEKAVQRMRARIHPPGTIIFPKIGGAIATNKRRILTMPSAIDNNCLGISVSPHIDIEWAYLILTSIDFAHYQAGTAVPALQQGTLGQIPIAVPPVAEQRRIVTKVDELMALCSQLEQSLNEVETTRSQLFEALLHEALDETAPASEAAQ